MNKTKGLKIDPKTVGGEEFVILLFFLKTSKIKTILKILKEVPPDIVCHGFWKKMGILQLMIS